VFDRYQDERLLHWQKLSGIIIRHITAGTDAAAAAAAAAPP